MLMCIWIRCVCRGVCVFMGECSSGCQVRYPLRSRRAAMNKQHQCHLETFERRNDDREADEEKMRRKGNAADERGKEGKLWKEGWLEGDEMRQKNSEQGEGNNDFYKLLARRNSTLIQIHSRLLVRQLSLCLHVLTPSLTSWVSLPSLPLLLPLPLILFFLLSTMQHSVWHAWGI